MATIDKHAAQDGKITYRVRVRLKGHPVQTASFARLTDARRWAQQTEAAIREGRHFKTAEAKRHTLAELIDRYVADVLPRKRDAKQQARQFDWWKRQIGDRPLSDVTPALVAEYRDRLAKGLTYRHAPRAPATVVRYLAALSHCLSVGVKEYGWIDDNPVRKVTKPKEPRGRVRFLSDEERERLLRACRADAVEPRIYPVVVLALSTGMRAQEVMRLRWPDVDLSRGRVVLHQTKNGERRAVPVAGPALELLRQHAKVRRIDTDLLFPGNRKAGQPFSLRPAWDRVIKHAEIADFRFHDLRHSAASYLAMSGASLAEIGEILGHKTLQMVKRYSHLSESHTANVVARMNSRIFGDGKTTG